MDSDKLAELEHRLAAMQSQLDGKSFELAGLDAELRIVQQRHSGYARLKSIVLAGLSVIAVAIASALPGDSEATLELVHPKTIPLPVDFTDSKGVAVVKIDITGITITDGNGTTLAYLGTDQNYENGYLEINNSKGAAMVKARVNSSGLGIVQVGPAGNGTAGLMGNSGLAASAILGKKE